MSNSSCEMQGFGVCLNAGLEITLLGATLFRRVSSSLNNVLAITNNNSGTEKSPQDQELISRTDLTEPKSSVPSTR